MRITRAAKVAAFPLTALILVALIACQGPAGPAGAAGAAGPAGADGKDGTDGAQGPPGMDAPHPLASKIIDTVYFGLPITVDADNTAPTKTVDVSDGFTGGTAEGRTYKVGAVTNTAAFSSFSFELEGSMLKLTVTASETITAGTVILDISIPIQATDTSGAVATSNVLVRMNQLPVVTDAATPIGLTVGLQDAPTMDGDDDDMDPDDYNTTQDNVTCVMLNSCKVTLAATDDNRDDSYEWAFYNTDPDSVMVMATNDGVMITGLKNAAAAVPVFVWAVDEGGFPMADEDGDYQADDETSTDIDESMYPVGARRINVTTDPPPSLGAAVTINGQMVTLPAQTLKTQEERLIGTVFDDEAITIPADAARSQIVNIAFDAVDTDNTDANGRGILAEARNFTAARETIKFKLMEPDSSATDNPQQYLDVSVDITVSN